VHHFFLFTYRFCSSRVWTSLSFIWIILPIFSIFPQPGFFSRSLFYSLLYASSPHGRLLILLSSSWQEGSTALHRASRLENLPVLELLLIAGVNKDAQDNASSSNDLLHDLDMNSHSISSLFTLPNFWWYRIPLDTSFVIPISFDSLVELLSTLLWITSPLTLQGYSH